MQPINFNGCANLVLKFLHLLNYSFRLPIVILCVVSDGNSVS